MTRLALAGATEAEIATLTGHSLRDVRTILDAHYLNRDPKLAEAAIEKLERRTKSPKSAVCSNKKNDILSMKSVG